MLHFLARLLIKLILTPLDAVSAFAGAFNRAYTEAAFREIFNEGDDEAKSQTWTVRALRKVIRLAEPRTECRSQPPLRGRE